MKRIVIALAGVVGIFALQNWFSCGDFLDVFNVIPQNVGLQVDDYIHTDVGIPRIITRFFHNKISGFFFEFMRHFIHYWDATFLINFISLISWIGLWFGMYYLYKKAKWYKPFLGVLALLLLVQFIELFLRPHSLFMPVIITLWLLYQAISIFGLWHFLSVKEHKLIRIGFCIVLLILSVWWSIVFPHDIYSYCAKL